MKIDQLTYFVAAAKHQHIGKAAHVVSISPSAISHSIAALEKELGRELFIKKGKRVYLTAHGKLLMERARALLEGVDKIKEELSSDEVDLQGHYRMAATHLLCSRLLVPAWTKVQNGSLLLSAEVYTLRSAQVAASVACGEMDFGLALSPQGHPQMDSRVLYKGRMVLVVRKGHPILKTPLAGRARSLSAYPACLPKAFQGIENCESHPELARHGLVPAPRFLFDSADVAAEHVIHSDSWGLFADWTLRFYRRELIPIVPRGWDAPFSLCALWPKQRPLGRALRRLVLEIQAALSRQGT